MVTIRCKSDDLFWQKIQNNLFGKLNNERIEILRKAVLGDRRYDAQMCSLTQDGRQFRVWNGRPYGFKPNHVDGFDPKGTIHVEGDPSEVEEYLRVIIKVLELTEVPLPNGSKVYLKVWHEL